MESRVNIRHWIVGSLSVFVIHTLFGYFVTHFVYPPSILSIGSSPTMQDPLFSRIFMHLSRLIFAGGFTFVFLRLHQGRVRIATGVRFGLLMAALLDVPAFFADMVRTPWGPSVIAMLCVVGVIEAIFLGVTLSVLSWSAEPSRLETSRNTLQHT